jgi:uncharacterized membrane protein
MENSSSTQIKPGTTRIGEVERWASLATATALVTYGLSRRTVRGAWLAAAATPLVYRGFAGHWPRLTNGQADGVRSALSGNRGIDVRESIRLEKPIDEVYRFWRRLENLPRFMTHLERVIEFADGRSHWIVRGPGGMRVEWDAHIINEVENGVIAWQSIANSDVVSAGSVSFETVRNGRSTQLTVHLQYAAPFGRPGRAVASIFGHEPSQTIREDLRRLKQFLEAGEIARGSAEEVEGARR